MTKRSPASPTNQKTLLSYEQHAQKYITGTHADVTGGMKNWIDLALSALPPGARILEIGSAFGRDAAYIQSKGFAVECADAVQKFVDLLLEKGFRARLLNVLTDSLPTSHYDLVFANAVLLHFTQSETKGVLAKIYRASRPGGLFAFSVKQGEGQKWTDHKLDAPRFYQFWTKKSLEAILEQSGFAGCHFDEASLPGSSDTWLTVIARKAG